MPRTRPIPWLIILIGLGFLALSSWSFYLAARQASAVTDADYYRHGLRFNQTMLEQKAATSLGWAAVPSLQGRVMTIQLRDREQRAVAGALGVLAISEPGKGGTRELGLHESAPGVYQTEFPADLHGEQAAEIIFLRDGARLHQRLLISLD